MLTVPGALEAPSVPYINTALKNNLLSRNTLSCYVYSLPTRTNPWTELDMGDC